MHISDVNLTEVSTNALVNVIECNPSLEELRLDDNVLQNGLLGVVKACKLSNLKTLDLSHNIQHKC